MAAALGKIDQMIQEGKQNQYVVTPNVDHLVKLEKDALFREIYDKAALVLTDGQPLIWISRLLGRPIVEKVSGSDLFPEVCRMAAKKGYSLFFLGADEGVADLAAEKLRKKYPDIRIVGTYSPPYGFESDKEEVKRIVQMVNSADTQILAVALGAPKQEKFFYENRDKFRVAVALHIGASLDFAAGSVKRAPRWMRRCGLEWLHRLLKDPGRLMKRYLVDDMAIFGIVWKYRNRK